jgi:putative membrane protein
MKASYFFSAIVGIFAVAMAGCASGSNTTVNVNRAAANSNSAVLANANAATNSNANGGSISNSVSNAVGSLTTDSPEDFVKEAAVGGLTEVELGKLASTKGANAEVKKFGQMMVADHSKANAELKALAAKKNITLPTAPDSSHQSTIDDMKGKSGGEFDEDYVDAMVDDHEDDVAAFEKPANNSTDPDVKAFAAKTLPTLKNHLEAIKAIQAKMNQ